jgi:4-amino-4-deoxy-L-arabinose transferase-like glycosyltransferase
MNKKQKWILFGIMLLAVILRCIAISNRNIQYDDAFSYFLARVSLENIIHGTAADTMPPLYYFLLHFWQLISTEVWFLRLLSVLLSLGAMFFLFAFMRRAISINGGLWAALYAAISPLQIYHAQDIRMYALLVFCCWGYLFFFYKVWENNNLKQRSTGAWIGMVAFGAGAMYTHNLAIFWIVAPVLFVVVRKSWKFLWKYLLALFLIGLTALPWLVMVPGQVQKIQGAFWTPRPGLVEIFQSIMMLTFNLPEPNRILFICGAILALYIFIMVIFRVVKNWATNPNLSLLAIACFLPPVLLFIVSYLIRPVFVIRGFIPSQMAFLGLAAAITSLDWKNRIGKLLAGLIIANAIFSYPALYTYAEFPRSPFHEASAKIKQAVEDGYLVVHDNKLSFFPVNFFFSSPNQLFLKDQPGSSNDTFAPASQKAMELHPSESIEFAAAGKSRLVFVVFQEAIDEYSVTKTIPPAVDWLKKNYALTRQEKIGDVLLMFFESRAK